MRAVRFADLQNGWVFQPDLWATHDGGAHWSRPLLDRVPVDAFVMALETSAGVVHAAVQGDGLDIESSPVGRDSWQRSPTTLEVGAGPVPYTVLVLHGDAGWFVEVDRTVIAGARLSGGRWSTWQPPCLTANGPLALAASTQNDLVAVCDEGVWGPPMPEATRAYLSHDGGASFQLSPVKVPGFAPVIASASPQWAEVGAAETFDGGRTWAPVLPAAAAMPTEIGFTSATQGVLIANDHQVDSPGGGMLMTFDGGHVWGPVDFEPA